MMRRGIAALLVVALLAMVSIGAFAQTGTISAIEWMYNYACMLNLMDIPTSSDGRMKGKNGDGFSIFLADDVVVAMDGSNASVLMAELRFDSKDEIDSMKMLAFMLAFDKEYAYSKTTTASDVIDYDRGEGILAGLAKSVTTPMEYCGYSFEFGGSDGDGVVVRAKAA